jgi:hypothetical protein
MPSTPKRRHRPGFRGNPVIDADEREIPPQGVTVHFTDVLVRQSRLGEGERT